MIRSTVMMIALGLTGVSSVGLAATFSHDDATGPRIEQHEAMTRAVELFEQIDIDQDGQLSVDEYASQAVIRASLARFRGTYEFQGGEFTQITLPEIAKKPISAGEQVTIDALARAEFYEIGGNDGALSKNAWLLSQLNDFKRADIDEDGQLRGHELDIFTLDIAKFQLTYS